MKLLKMHPAEELSEVSPCCLLHEAVLRYTVGWTNVLTFKLHTTH